MIVNIEAEYNDYISDNWNKVSDKTSQDFENHADPDTYDTISTLSIRFLQEKLKNLEHHDT
ncbi:MAG: hypothetical protein ACYSR5_00660 [Planctomycetota bacterium]|jgi:hypothetical protein